MVRKTVSRRAVRILSQLGNFQVDGLVGRVIVRLDGIYLLETVLFGITNIVCPALGLKFEIDSIKQIKLVGIGKFRLGHLPEGFRVQPVKIEGEGAFRFRAFLGKVRINLIVVRRIADILECAPVGERADIAQTADGLAGCGLPNR